MNDRRPVISRKNLPAAWETPILGTAVAILLLAVFPQPMIVNVIAVLVGLVFWVIFLARIRTEKEVDVLGDEE